MHTIRRITIPAQARRGPARHSTGITGQATGGTGGTTSGGIRWRTCLSLANAITTLGLLSGVAAIWTAQRGGIPLPPGRLRLAAGLIAAAAALDAIDGPVARRRRTTGPFGRELDSLADLAAFGVAPAVVLYDARLAAVPVAGEAAAAVWCVCAAWRLARFPLCQRDSGFTGCPVPLAAVTVTIAALAAPPLLTLLAVTTASLLMISTVSFPTWHAITRILRRKYQ